MAKKYIILNTSELDSLDFNELLNTSEDYVRKSTNGTKAIVSYEGTTTSALSGKTEYTFLTIDFTLRLMNKSKLYVFSS